MKRFLPYLLIVIAAALTVYLLYSRLHTPAPQPPAQQGNTVLPGRILLTHSGETAAAPEVTAALLASFPELAAQVDEDGQAAASYLYNRLDLNDDGTDEVLVYLSAPPLCGARGCRLLILEAEEDTYAVRSNIGPVRNPIAVFRQRTHGWSDLLLRVPGEGSQADYNVVLRHDGTGYPADPTAPEAEVWDEAIDGTGYLNSAPGASHPLTAPEG